MLSRVCAYCEKAFYTDIALKKYCSYQCCRKATRKKRQCLANRICEVCKKEFTPTFGTQVNCSDKCRANKYTRKVIEKRIWENAISLPENVNPRDIISKFTNWNLDENDIPYYISSEGFKIRGIWIRCKDCNQYTPAKKYNTGRYCSQKCFHNHKRQENHSNWKGGRSVSRLGYARINAPDGRRMHEHRWVVEQAIGRRLLPNENVHHKNGDRSDNRIENLELWVKTQPAGIRVNDLKDYISKYFSDPYLEAISSAQY